MNLDFLKGFFELIKDLFTNDKYMRQFLRVFFTALFSIPIIYFLWIWGKFEWDSYHGKHVTLFGNERNIPVPEKVYVLDTIHIRDTITREISTFKANKMTNPVNVQSDHQKGGQTAGEIINH